MLYLGVASDEAEAVSSEHYTLQSLATSHSRLRCGQQGICAGVAATGSAVCLQEENTFLKCDGT